MEDKERICEEKREDGIKVLDKLKIYHMVKFLKKESGNEEENRKKGTNGGGDKLHGDRAVVDWDHSILLS